MKVFVGISEIAGLVANYAKGFRALGLDTYTVVGAGNPFYPAAHYDEVLLERLDRPRRLPVLPRAVSRSVRSRLAAAAAFSRIIRTCDLFIYNTGGSLLPGYLDYRLIKRAGKKLVVAFLGSEIRHWSAYKSEMTERGYLDRVRPFVEHITHHNYGNYVQMRERVRQAERWADLILSQPGFAQLQTRPYMRVIAPLDLTQLTYTPRLRDIPLVLHAPTSRGVKGTEHVLAAVDALQREGVRFEFRLIEKMPHEAMCRLLEDSDIVVDELYSDTTGVLSAEAMATGNVVLTSYFPDFARVPAGCPALDVHAGTVKATLRQAIIDRELRGRLTGEGRRYVEQHHDCANIARQILAWVEPGGISTFDFTPTFHSRFRVPDQVLREEKAEARRARRAKWSGLLR
jgi:glycosyltransferase involved in cell wall biosynthesis